MSSHPQLRIQNPILPPPRQKTSSDKGGAGKLGLRIPGAKPSIEAELIRAQVERIVASPPFRKSNRYPRLLKFIVDQTLAGNADQLKERSLGIEVFDRAPDYELRTDPIVRVAAGELRKRLAQYYIQNHSESELRIELQPGSYVPEFHWPQQVSVNSTVPFPDVAVDRSPVAQTGTGADQNRKRRWVALAALPFVFALAAIFALTWTSRPSATEIFWGPLFNAKASPMICIGDTHDLLSNAPGDSPATLPGFLQSSYLPNITDVNVANQASEVLASHGKRAFVQDSSMTTQEQLSRQPVILIGWRNNRWSQRAVQLLRFRMTGLKGDQARTIVDAQNPSQPRWVVDPKGVELRRTGETYAIIARFEDPASGQPTILIAGIGDGGTTAAARFITDDRFLQSFVKVAPGGWEKKNLELVVETHVITDVNGASGPPHLVAWSAW